MVTVRAAVTAAVVIVNEAEVWPEGIDDAIGHRRGRIAGLQVDGCSNDRRTVRDDYRAAHGVSVSAHHRAACQCQLQSRNHGELSGLAAPPERGRNGASLAGGND